MNKTKKINVDKLILLKLFILFIKCNSLISYINPSNVPQNTIILYFN